MGKVPVQVTDRCPVDVGKLPVDATGLLFQRVTDLGVGRDLRAAVRRDLYVAHFPLFLGEHLQESLEGGEALGQALAVVQPVDADQAFPAEQARNPAHALHGLLVPGLDRFRFRALDVHADREHAETQLSSADRDAAVGGHGFGPEDFHDRGAEGIQVASSLEADQVKARQLAHEFCVRRERPQCLDVREGDVQEESDRLLRAELAQLPGQRDEVIVVDPDLVPGLEQRVQPLGELPVHAQIGFVLRVVVMRGIQEIVKQRPDRAVAEAEVIELVVFGRQIHGGEAQLAAARDFRRAHSVLTDLAAPAEPQAATGLHGGQYTDGEATRGDSPLRQRDTVRNGNQSAHRSFSSSGSRLSRNALSAAGSGSCSCACTRSPTETVSPP